MDAINELIGLTGYSLDTLYLGGLLICFGINFKSKELKWLTIIILSWAAVGNFLLFDWLSNFPIDNLRREAWYLGWSLYEVAQIASIIILRKYTDSEYVLSDLILMIASLLMMFAHMTRYIDRSYLGTNVVGELYQSVAPAMYLITLVILATSGIIRLGYILYYKDLFNGSGCNHSDDTNFSARVFRAVCGS